MRHWNARDDRVMRVMHRFGDSPEAIARYLDRAPSTILRRLRKAGLRPHLDKKGFTADMDETIRRNYPMWPAFLIGALIDRSASSVFQRAVRLGVKKHPGHWRNPMAHLWNATSHPNSIAARFKPGQVPANKGVRRPGYAPGRMAETQFKKGQMYGAARHNYVPVGTLRICADGYLERKVTDDHPVPARRWVAVHRMVWEAAHGPIPKGHIVRFRAGMKTTNLEQITVDKLEMVTHAENMRRNTVHNYPKPIVRMIQLRGALNRQINRRRKREQQQHQQ